MSGSPSRRAPGPAVLLATLLATGLLLAGCGKHGTRGDNAGNVHAELAGAYLARGQMEVAMQEAKQALAEAPDDAGVQRINALIYQRLGESAEAEEHFRRAVELDPKDSVTRNALGAYYCVQKRYPEADAQFNQALANPLDPTPWMVLTNAGLCAKAAGDGSKARGYFGQALERNPNFGPALLAMADLDVAQGDAHSASTLLARYFKTSPPTAQALALGVRVERQLGNKKVAASYATVLKQRFPDTPEAKSL